MINASQRLILKCLAASAVTLALTACGNNASTSTTTSTTTVLAASDLSGAYVFTVKGTDPNDGDYAIAGTFTADGKGNISSGVADYNLGGAATDSITPGGTTTAVAFAAGTGIDASVPLTGTYTVANGIATINLTDGGSVTESYFVPVIKTGTAVFTRYDGTGSGTLYAPVTSTAPAGTYAVAISGEGDNTVTASASFTVNTFGTFSGGTETYADGNNSFSYTGVGGFFYPKLANGRGQAAIGGNAFSYYMATSNQLVLLGLDDRALLTGTATKQ